IAALKAEEEADQTRVEQDGPERKRLVALRVILRRWWRTLMKILLSDVFLFSDVFLVFFCSFVWAWPWIF
ncbi:hypothetical protein A2U01_0103000, partial [Trifolium medium]|nr:hypothetical protein [Trifolium medium]